MQNFTVTDLVQTTAAILSFSLLLLSPGFVLGWASNIFSFRARGAAEKLVFSAVLSTATAPVFAVLITRFLGYPVSLGFFLLVDAAAVILCVKEYAKDHPRYSGIARTTWLAFGLVLGWFVIVQVSLADFQWGQRLYLNYAAFDHSVRVPFVEAAARTGVPPLNPFYGLGQIPVLRYYYYWYVVCALPMRLLGLSARACFNASVFWSGIALAATIPLFLKHFFHEAENLRRKSVIGIALLAVTGLDLIPFAAMFATTRVVIGDLEWWDENQVTSWIGSLLWVPHHVAALIACMAGLLVISEIDEESSLRKKVWATVLSSLAFASAAGLSIYVAFTFAIFAVVWVGITLFRGQIKTAAVYIGAAGFSILLSLPYLSDLSNQSTAGQRFAFFSLRDLTVASELLKSWGIQNSFLLDFAKAPSLLIVYVLEFGFFLCVAVLRFRQESPGRTDIGRRPLMAWTMFAICLLAMTILKSDTSGGNDLGFRGMLVVQFVLLLWAAPLVDDVFFTRASSKQYSKLVQILLISTLLIGVSGTIFQVFALRSYMPMDDAGIFKPFIPTFGNPPGMGQRAFSLREGFSQIDKLTPEHVVVQYNPVGEETLLIHLYSPRQAAAADETCGSSFGGDVEKCKRAAAPIAGLFTSPEVSRGWDIDRFCDTFSINVLVATDVDPVWQDRNSWVWTKTALVENRSLRAIPCGTRTAAKPGS